MKEKWTIEMEVDVEQSEGYLWEHMINLPHFCIDNDDDGIIDGCLDGIHWHAYENCTKMMDWKVVKREPIEVEVHTK